MSESSRGAWLFNAALLGAALTAAYVIIALTNENRDLRAQLESLRGSPLEESLAAGDVLPAVDVLGPEGRRSLGSLFETGGVAVFLTTTCPYCLQTLPTWGELAADLGTAGVPFHGVSFHPSEPTWDYVRQHAIEWPVWVVPDASAAAQVRVASVPFTVLLGPGAVVRQVWLGPLSDEDLVTLRGAALAAATP